MTLRVRERRTVIADARYHRRAEFDLRSALSRRRMLGAGLAGTGALLAGCAPAARSRGGTAWSYTDSRGKRVALDHRPNRIIAYSSILGGLAAYGVRCVGVFGFHDPVDGKPHPFLGGASLKQVTSLSGPGQFDLSGPEEALAVRPDLILGKTLSDPPEPFGISKETVAKLEPVVPIALLNVNNRPLPELLEHMAELAGTLGGSPRSAAALAARTRFRMETEKIERILAAKPRFRVLVVSGTPQNAYLYRAKAATVMRYLSGHGMQLVDPGDRAPDSFFVETSWEDFGDIEADVIWYDARFGSKALRQMMAIPTFRNHPAVRAGQVVPLYLELPPSYQQWATELGTIAGWTDRFRRL